MSWYFCCLLVLQHSLEKLLLFYHWNLSISIPSNILKSLLQNWSLLFLFKVFLFFQNFEFEVILKLRDNEVDFLWRKETWELIHLGDILFLKYFFDFGFFLWNLIFFIKLFHVPIGWLILVALIYLFKNP